MHLQIGQMLNLCFVVYILILQIAFVTYICYLYIYLFVFNFFITLLSKINIFLFYFYRFCCIYYYRCMTRSIDGATFSIFKLLFLYLDFNELF